MILDALGPQHLAYCLNVHPGETLEDIEQAIRSFALPVKETLSPHAPFGLGLRISNEGSIQLADAARRAGFRQMVERLGFYVFTVNGFPYGTFHADRVKENAYRPDWQSRDRLAYTLRLSDILADLLPDGVGGSISTVPVSYRAWIDGDAKRDQCIAHLLEAADHLRRIEEGTGRRIQLGLEPEPDCFLENTDDVLAFFADDRLAAPAVRAYLGVCFDTCHFALQFEDLCESLQRIVSEGIRVSKVQISSALRTVPDATIGEKLVPFCDPVYLHQVKARQADGSVHSRGDLDDVLAAGLGPAGDREWRVHCHVPSYFDGADGVFSTSQELSPAFFGTVAECGVEHLEIETYTFDVLPLAARDAGIVDSLVHEYRWVLGHLD